MDRHTAGVQGMYSGTHNSKVSVSSCMQDATCASMQEEELTVQAMLHGHGRSIDTKS